MRAGSSSAKRARAGAAARHRVARGHNRSTPREKKSPRSRASERVALAIRVCEVRRRSGECPRSGDSVAGWATRQTRSSDGRETLAGSCPDAASTFAVPTGRGLKPPASFWQARGGWRPGIHATAASSARSKICAPQAPETTKRRPGSLLPSPPPPPLALPLAIFPPPPSSPRPSEPLSVARRRSGATLFALRTSVNQSPCRLPGIQPRATTPAPPGARCRERKGWRL